MTDNKRHSFWDAASIDPEKKALVEQDSHRSVTFKQLDLASRQIARLFQASGADTRGSVVLAILDNSIEFFEAYLACLQTGTYFVPVSPATSQDDLTWILEDCVPRIIVANKSHDRIRKAVEELGMSIPLFTTGDPETGFQSLSKAAELYSEDPLLNATAGSRLLYTGGTTGKPKGVRFSLSDSPIEDVSHRLCDIWAGRIGYSESRGPHLVSCPLYHGLALAMSSVALHLGNTLVLMKEWTPSKWLETVEKHSISTTAMVPTMLSRLKQANPEVGSAAHTTTLSSIVHSGAPCAPELKHWMLRTFGNVLYEFYGASEAVGTAITPEEWVKHVGSVGRPLPGADIRIVDSDGEELPPHSIGEVLIKGAFGQATFTGSASVRPGFSTWPSYASAGDIGYTDEEGFLYLTDRVADVIVSGGVNIYSARVEAALASHPDVNFIAVIGGPDSDWGERVIAIVEPLPTASNSTLADDLDRIARDSLSPAQRPKEFRFVEAMPLTAAGKIDKNALRTALLTSGMSAG